ncbi:MAG: methionine adenosyltransferase [Omnitrophica bacterium RIFCSPHIGHO2_02_FULL_46_11]|nr:MAG: methionine adenosyltransferase [Omnitrophica bacterium RIFCSPHIGHO2_02_FULL_46_11]OGW87660.1 MAG: methionine adenosyltransferase [Omnitrophica bacterium RIFCSPLOWO2_01_FULL_45_10b]
MNRDKYLFTSESVGEGHPDKLCDQVSDAILDAFLAQDPNARVACEALVSRNNLVIAGEITAKAQVDIPKIARQVIKEIGYDDLAYGFDYKTCTITTHIHQQSPDIAMGVDTGGAGDQGMMFGYAADETPELMPIPIMLAHKLVFELAKIRKSGQLKYLRPDAKSQVTVEYNNGKPTRVVAIVVSTQHDGAVQLDTIERDIKSLLIEKVIPQKYLDKTTKIFVNPTGRFEVGGPLGDTGLTGRKIIVDTYGGVGAHGGGAFSGKDPSKVDRSASYFARYVAKNIVAAKLASRCEIQVAYAIGVAEPVSIMVNTFGTGSVSDNDIVTAVRKVFDFTPRGIIKRLNLRRPVYRQTAAYGHFGRTGEGFTWELTDAAETLRAEAFGKSDHSQGPSKSLHSVGGRS